MQSIDQEAKNCKAKLDNYSAIWHVEFSVIIISLIQLFSLSGSEMSVTGYNFIANEQLKINPYISIC